MLKPRIIPCLDIREGKVVKGIKFKNIVDVGDPVLQAEFYSKANADELCFLDITASNENRDIIFDVVSNVAKKCFIPFTVGGGINNVDVARKILALGADKIAINSAAVANPDLISQLAQEFGSQCVVVSIDAKKILDKKETNELYSTYHIFTHGGRRDSNIDVKDWIQIIEDKGAGEILLTSMDRDGTREGYDHELNQLVKSNVKIPVIASGGVGKKQDFVDGIKKGKVDALLAASCFHYRHFSVNEVKLYLQEHGIDVRIDKLSE